MSALNWITVAVSMLSIAISVQAIVWIRQAKKMRENHE